MVGRAPRHTCDYDPIVAARIDTPPPSAGTTESAVDAGTRSQVAEFLRMTPSERLASLVSTVQFIERGREAMRRIRG